MPGLIFVMGIVFTWSNRQVDRSDARAAQQHAAIQGFYDRITRLIVDDSLLQSEQNSALRATATFHTRTVLLQVDAEGKRYIIQFLIEAGLIRQSTDEHPLGPIVDLSGADLSGADLSNLYAYGPVSLSGAILDGADLSGARFLWAEYDFTGVDTSGCTTKIGADFTGASLRNVSLENAEFEHARMDGADLSGADLRCAMAECAELDGARVEGATFDHAMLFRTSFRTYNPSASGVHESQLAQSQSYAEANLNKGMAPDPRDYFQQLNGFYEACDID